MARGLHIGHWRGIGGSAVVPPHSLNFSLFISPGLPKIRIPYPEAIIDTCLGLHRSGELELPEEALSFFYLDWAYTVLCCVRQIGNRRQECETMIGETSGRFVEKLAAMGEESREPFPDLHALCGAVSGLAAVQQLLPELVHTDKPLRLALDRRPFQ